MDHMGHTVRTVQINPTITDNLYQQQKANTLTSLAQMEQIVAHINMSLVHPVSKFGFHNHSNLNKCK